MTDKSSSDRAYLCHLMRVSAEWLPSFHADVMKKAADEIEKLEIKIKHLEAEVEDERQSHKATIRDMSQLSASCNAKIYDDYDQGILR